VSYADHDPRLRGDTLHQNCKCFSMLLSDDIFVQLTVVLGKQDIFGWECNEIAGNSSGHENCYENTEC